jgi:NAD(P)-dependent dehydrogenase (short-subunit alcohol dehydrogenase family)
VGQLSQLKKGIFPAHLCRPALCNIPTLVQEFLIDLEIVLVLPDRVFIRSCYGIYLCCVNIQINNTTLEIMKKVVLITGASSGMGKSTANILHTQGYIVYGAARRTDEMNDLKEKGMKVVLLDLTNDESIQKAVDTILTKEGRIDILINNAGYGSYGAVEDVPLEEARRQFEVNLFGMARLTQLVLPTMRAQRYGRIVNISSMGGKIYTPFGAWYHATKHAVEGWSDCLRLEVKEFGIDVVVVEPGGIKTPWGSIAADNLQKTSGSGAYAAFARKVAQATKETYQGNQLTDVDVLGKTIAKAATDPKPKTRYVKGYMAKPAIAIRKWFGDRVFDKVIMSQVKSMTKA